MKKIFLITIVILIGFTQKSLGQDYDLNLVTTKNDRVVGGDYWVKVQVRATTSKVSFFPGILSLGLGYNPAALNIVNANPSFNWIPPFNAHYDLPLRNVLSTPSPTVAFGRAQVFGSPANIQITTAWVDLIELRFTIVDTDENLGFNLLGLGYVGNGAQEFKEIVGINEFFMTQGVGYTSVTFNGTNWVGGNGALGAPDATDGCKEIVVQSGTATLTGTVETDYIAVTSGAQLVVGPNATLRPFTQSASNGYSVPTTDAFLIDADATGYGQYIGPGLPGTIKQYVGTDIGWRNMAFPVSGGSAFSVGGHSGGFNAASTSYNAAPDCSGNWGNYINTVNVYRFNEGAQPHEWYGAASAPTGGTSGFNIFTGAPFGTSGIATIKGTFLDPANNLTYAYSHTAPHVATTGTGSQSGVTQGAGCISEPVVDRQANWNGWALVANPFPCNLDVAEFAVDNGISTNQIRIWSRTNDQYVESDNGTLGFTSIAPMQSFWIKVGTPSSFPLSIVFQDDQRVFDVANYLKYSGNQISLSAANTTTQVQAQIHLQFNSAASKGYDQLYDSYSYSQPGNTAPQLTFHNTYMSNGNPVVAPLDYNTVPEVVSSDSYQLRFWSRSAGQFEFTVDTATMLPAWNVYIEDLLLAPNQYVNITHSAYSFNYDPATDSPTRFIMHFAPSGSLNIDEDKIVKDNTLNAYAYTDDSGIRVAFRDYPFDNVSIQIFNSAGQLLSLDKNVSTDKVYLFPVNEKIIGFYIVTVKNEDGSLNTFKVTR